MIKHGQSLGEWTCVTIRFLVRKEKSHFDKLPVINHVGFYLSMTWKAVPSRFQLEYYVVGKSTVSFLPPSTREHLQGSHGNLRTRAAWECTSKEATCIGGKPPMKTVSLWYITLGCVCLPYIWLMDFKFLLCCFMDTWVFNMDNIQWHLNNLAQGNFYVKEFLMF